MPVRWVFAFGVLLLLPRAGAATNLWLSHESAAWHEPFWSLRILPAPDHWVAITNAGSRTVEINAETAAEYPESLVMEHLLVQGGNSLLLTHGTERPLHLEPATNVWNGLEISEGGALTNLGSGLQIDGLFRISTRAQVYQDGGFVKAPGTTYLYGASYYLADGWFDAGWVDLPVNGRFDQHGGVARVQTLRLFDRSTYTLHAGEAHFHTLEVKDSSSVIQHGGTNRVESLLVWLYMSGNASYLLNGGALYTSNTIVAAGMSPSRFEQNGGLHVVTNQFTLRGSARYYPPLPTEASYTLGQHGQLHAASFLFDARYGFSYFETSGQASFSEGIRFLGSSGYTNQFQIRGGTLAARNVSHEGAVIDIHQTGGAFIVTNLFEYGGHYEGIFHGQGARPARYTFTAGTFSARDIALSADWFIGPGSPGRIIHTGKLLMQGGIEIQNAFEQMGSLVLLGNSFINFSGNSGQLAFASSVPAAWTEHATLTIENWNGSFNGGGAEQLRFGQEQHALSSAQLSQIRFLNPAGLPAGEYEARILETGELVPLLPPPTLASQRLGQTLELNWTGSAILQTATHIEGTWDPVPGATPPFTFQIQSDRSRFFRIILP